MTSRRALLLFVALTALHTWPLWTAPWRQSLNHNADVQYATWSLSWVAHTIATAPAHVFDGNIFAPEPTTLAYSEPVITPALAGRRSSGWARHPYSSTTCCSSPA